MIHLLHDIGIGFFLAIAFVILLVGPVFYREWHVRYREKWQESRRSMKGIRRKGNASYCRVRQCLPRWWRDSEPGVRGESLGVRSTVVGFQVVGVQTVEEFPDRPLGSEYVKDDMLTVLRNDIVFALRL